MIFSNAVLPTPVAADKPCALGAKRQIEIGKQLTPIGRDPGQVGRRDGARHADALLSEPKQNGLLGRFSIAARISSVAATRVKVGRARIT
jgi:hypothetical protein